MSDKKIKISAAFFLLGILLIFIGFAFGEDLGIMLSRPFGANVWEVSEGKIYACTFIPIISGIYSLIISLIITINIIDDRLYFNKDKY
ncbi:hypothetical protein [Clostridium tertium]|uniref:hypothetical protein n=1 Tax=Clostridium tertium TaxID=1559 RepID=UPI00374F4112